MGVAYDFGGKVAVVTGAGGGIGQAYAEALAGSGAFVVVADIDVADPGSAAAMAAPAGECYGGIDDLTTRPSSAACRSTRCTTSTGTTFSGPNR